jgi:hypothetical protein
MHAISAVIASASEAIQSAPAGKVRIASALARLATTIVDVAHFFLRHHSGARGASYDAQLRIRESITTTAPLAKAGATARSCYIRLRLWIPGSMLRIAPE